MAAKPVPEGFHTITPYLTVADLAAELDFLAKALGAVEAERLAMPDGTLMHAQVKIGDSFVFLGQHRGDGEKWRSMLYLYVDDADALFNRAVAAGARVVMPPTDMPYGDRAGAIDDPAGNQWWIASHKEDLSPKEIEQRMTARAAG